MALAAEKSCQCDEPLYEIGCCERCISQESPAKQINSFSNDKQMAIEDSQITLNVKRQNQSENKNIKISELMQEI